MGTPVMGSPAGSFKRGPQPVQSNPFEVSRGLKGQQPSGASDSRAGDGYALDCKANGLYHQVSFLRQRDCTCAAADVDH